VFVSIQIPRYESAFVPFLFSFCFVLFFFCFFFRFSLSMVTFLRNHLNSQYLLVLNKH